MSDQVNVLVECAMPSSARDNESKFALQSLPHLQAREEDQVLERR